MSETESSPDKLAQSLTVAQIEKLNLEIQCLKDKSRWQDTLAKLTPLISVLLAVGGFGFGIYQYYSQQERSRITEETGQKIRVQSQIRENLNQILRFPNDKNLTVSKIAFTFEDLKQLLKIRVPDAESGSKSLQDEQREITSILVNLILEDCNFDEPRDVSFVFSILDHWEDYQNYIKNDPDTIINLLIKYGDCLTSLRDKAPCFITLLKYSDDKYEYVEPDRCPRSDTSDLRHFGRLVEGFVSHVKLLDQDSSSREYAIKLFQASICNETLTRQEFGISFDPKSDPVIFKDCYSIGNK